LDFRGQAIIWTWIGTVAITLIFLYYQMIASVVIIFPVGAFAITVWLANKTPFSVVQKNDLILILNEISSLDTTVQDLKNKVDEVKRLIEE